MKKWITVTMMLLAVFACGFIPVTTSGSLKINAPYDNSFRQFTSPGGWLNWYPGLKVISKSNKIEIDSNKSGFQINAPLLEIKLTDVGLGNFIIKRTLNGKGCDFSCALIPDSKSNKTIVAVISKTNLFGYLRGIVSNNDKQSPISELKTYMEDSRLYYGFTIKRELTIGKLVAVKKTWVLNTSLHQQVNGMLAYLNSFVLKNRLEIVSPLQLQYVAAKGDSTQIMLGSPVNKKVAAPNDIEYMTMPKGKILVGYFNGIYKNKNKLYDAMRRYMSDNYIHPMIQPFERFDNNMLPTDDSQLVNMQLVIPYI